MMKLSVLIPVYNESRTLPTLLEKLDSLNLPPEVAMDFIFVDDASSDASALILKEHAAGRGNVRVLTHERNLGKGAAIRSALKAAAGDVVIIQDADLEYDPNDFRALLVPLLDGRADVVFGSRNLSDNPRYSIVYYWGNLLLNAFVFLLYGKYVSDMETCYKLMRRNIFLELDLQANGFDIEPEITAKLLRLGHPIVEVPIRYDPRTRAEGKKITSWDGFLALWALIRWRLAPIRDRPRRQDFQHGN